MLQVNSYAKINLILDLLAKRPDGYHEVSMVMQSVSLADRLTLTKTEIPGIKVRTNIFVTEEYKDNLAYKAAAQILAKYPQDSGLEIYIEKAIPIAAGLAGGSTDCAGAILGVNELFELKMDHSEISEIAAGLGSDINFCLTGGTALAEGRGELITKLPDVPEMFGLILKPPFEVSTAAVYKLIPQNWPVKKMSGSIKKFTKGQINIKNIEEILNNDLYQYACLVQPGLPKYIKLIKQTEPVACQMSGSGSAIFAFYENIEKRDKSLDKLRDFEVFPVRTSRAGQEVNKLSTMHAS